MTKTEHIFQTSAPYSNPYQGVATRLLFVCSVGMLRSPTAANVAVTMGFNARSCGSTLDMALIPITANLIMWADVIIFVNRENYTETLDNFKQFEHLIEEINQKTLVMNIEDSYDYGSPMLKQLVIEYLENTTLPL